MSGIMFLAALAAQEPVKIRGPVKVFLLAGQSNMQGHGHVRTLDWLGEDATYGHLLKSLKAPDGSWVKRDDQIGPEWMFGTVMADHLENRVLLIKTAWGGRSLAINFRPPGAGAPPLEKYPEKQRLKMEEDIKSGKLEVGKEYREMIAQTKSVLADLKTHFPELAAYGHELAGFVWFQGWNDMIDSAFTAEYESNLEHLMRDLPKDLGVPGLPCVVAEMGIDGPATANPKILAFRKAQAMKDLQAKPAGFAPSSEYGEKSIEGWTVKVHREVEERAVRLLETRLADVVRVVPAKACEELRKVPIWLGGGDGKRAGAQYHPDRGWLEKNNYNPDKAKAVDIGDGAKFVHEVKRQPFMVLHELAHAYHDRVLGFGHEGIRAAYDGAVKGGKYESVLFWDNRKVKHYAIKDHKEYFAEGSEAFFGTNDFYPFVRAELKEHDPAIVEVLEAVWGTKDK